jgi:hypothetical protein
VRLENHIYNIELLTKSANSADQDLAGSLSPFLGTDATSDLIPPKRNTALRRLKDRHDLISAAVVVDVTRREISQCDMDDNNGHSSDVSLDPLMWDKREFGLADEFYTAEDVIYHAEQLEKGSINGENGRDGPKGCRGPTAMAVQTSNPTTETFGRPVPSSHIHEISGGVLDSSVDDDFDLVAESIGSSIKEGRGRDSDGVKHTTTSKRTSATASTGSSRTSSSMQSVAVQDARRKLSVLEAKLAVPQKKSVSRAWVQIGQTVYDATSKSYSSRLKEPALRSEVHDANPDANSAFRQTWPCTVTQVRVARY